MKTIRHTGHPIHFVYCLLLVLFLLLSCQNSRAVLGQPTETLPTAMPQARVEPSTPPQPAQPTPTASLVLAPLPKSTAVPRSAAGATSASSENTSTPITIQFVMERAPKLNEPVAVTVTVKTARDAPTTTAALELHASAQLVSGTASYKGELKRDQPVQFEGVIKFTAEGNYTVNARARCVINQGMVWGDLATIYLHVGRDASYFGFESAPSSLEPGGDALQAPAITPGP